MQLDDESPKDEKDGSDIELDPAETTRPGNGLVQLVAVPTQLARIELWL